MNNTSFFTRLGLLSVIFAATALFTSCSSDSDDTPFGNGDISLSTAQAYFMANDSKEIAVTVTSETDNWRIGNGYPDWIIPVKRDNNTLALTVANNQNMKIRSGEIRLETADQTATLTVYQAGTATEIGIELEDDHVSAHFKHFEAYEINFEVKGTDGEEGITLQVKSHPEWMKVDVQMDTDPLRTRGKLLIDVDANTSHRSREGEIVVESFGIESTITVEQAAHESYILELDKLADVSSFAQVSNNGRYVSCMGLTYTSAIYDIETGDVHKLGNGVFEVVDLKDPARGQVQLFAVSDNGIGVGSASLIATTSNRSPVAYSTKTKTMSALDCSGTTLGDITTGGCFGINSDGSLMVGYVNPTANDNTILKTYPVMWVNGKMIPLAHPTDVWAEKLDMNSYIAISSYIARWINHDSTIIYGYMNDMYTKPIPCYWEVNNPDEVHFILQDDPELYEIYTPFPREFPNRRDFTDFPIVDYASVDNIISGRILHYNSLITQHYTYNVKTKEYKKYTSTNGEYLIPTPDGSIIYSLKEQQGATYGITRIDTGSEDMTLIEWLKKYHRLEFDNTDYLTIRGISRDGKTMVGRSHYGSEDKPIIISL